MSQQRNFMDMTLDGVMNKHSTVITSDNRMYQKDNVEHLKKVNALVKEILGLFDKHEITPMEGYMVTGALSDAIYLMLAEQAINSPRPSDEDVEIIKNKN